MADNNKSKPRAAFWLGFTGLIISIPITVLFGWIPAAVGIFIGMLAMLAGVRTRRKTNKQRGTGGIVMGVISVVFALSFMTAFLIFPDRISETAGKKGFHLIAEHTGALKYGVVGFMLEIDSEKDADYYLNQLDEIKRNK